LLLLWARPISEVVLFDVQGDGLGRVSICHVLTGQRRLAASLRPISGSDIPRKYNPFKYTWKRDGAEKTADECKGYEGFHVLLW